MTLAILGGEPLWKEPWPRWPSVSPRTNSLIAQVLESGKWTVTGQALVPAKFDREIAQRWADYVGVRHALACSSGSAGLMMALEALDIGPGDEVIVPGMTWVACPQSVYNVGAVPIIVDIDPDTLSIDPIAAERAVTPQTKAILVVHAYCGLADMDAILAIAKRNNIALIEDASQAHGGAWRGRRTGSFGDISVFSVQQSKLLTCGEGGLVATDRPDLHERLHYARTDGRRAVDGVSPHNWMSIAGSGEYQGRNLILPELSCAVLSAALDELDSQNDRRAEAMERLQVAFESRGGSVAMTAGGKGTTRRVAWRLTLRVDRGLFSGLSARIIGRAVTAELGLPVEPVDTPFNRNPLYAPLKVPRVARRDNAGAYDPGRFALPVANRVHPELLAIPHFALLAGKQAMEAVAESFAKVMQNKDALSRALTEGTVTEGASSR